MLRRCLCLFWMLAVVAHSASAQSAGVTANGRTTWTAAPLEDVLHEFGERSGLNLVFAVRLVRDKRVSATYTAGEYPETALGRILTGTGVLAQPLRPGQYVLIPEPVTVEFGIDDGYEATTGTLDGRIVDAVTGEALFGASVYLIDIRVGAVADGDGGFSIPNLPAGRYTARVTYVGYRTARLAMDVFPFSPRLPPTIRMQPEPVASERAQVESGAGDSTPAPGVSDVAARGPTTVASAAGRGDLGAALASLPGLTRTGAAGGRLVVRGADPDALRVLRDGVPVYAPWHAGGLVTTLQPEALGRVLLHRGQSPVALSGGLAAILETETTSPLSGDSARTLALSPIAARGVADVSLYRGVGLHVAGLRSVLGVALAPGVRRVRGVWAVDPLGRRRGDALRPHMAFQSAEASLGVALTRTARLDVAAWGADDRLRLDGVGSRLDDDLWARDRSGAVSARLRGLVGARTYATGLLYTTRVESETERATDLADTRETLDEAALGLTVEQAVGVHTLSLGTHAALRRVAGRFGRGAQGGTVEDRDRGQQLDLFAADTWSPGLGWQIQAGLRAEATRGARPGEDAVVRLRLSPRLFARWTPIRDRLIVRAGVTRQTQSVQRLSVTEGPLARVGERWAVAGPAGAPASAWQAGLGAEWAPTSRLALSADVYARLERDVLRRGAPVTDLSDRLSGFSPHGGRAAGVEVAARYVGAQWTVSGAGALALAETRTNGQQWRSAPFARPVSGSVRVERRIGALGVGARLGGASGLSSTAGRDRSDLLAGIAVGWIGKPFGVRVDALALAQARILGAPRGAGITATLPLPLAVAGRALPAWPTLSVTAQW